MTTKRIAYGLILAAALFAAWLAGLVIFVATVGHLTEPTAGAAIPPAEAIVALTGGSERITAGLQLLAAGKGRKLFVSGVPAGLTPGQILAKESVPPELRDCCIVLGHAAGNTFGNAEETRAWMAAENFHSLRLVTAHYHMPRSVLIFRNVMPDIKIVPHPVAPDSVKLGEWWFRPGTASLLILEYSKYLYALTLVELRLAP